MPTWSMIENRGGTLEPKKDVKNVQHKLSTKSVSRPRLIYQNARRSVGFQSNATFGLFLMLSSLWMSFILFSMRLYDYDGRFKHEHTFTGDWYYLKHGLARLAQRFHLATVLPAGLLVVFQFFPIAQRKYKTFHKFNGYIVSALLLAGIVPTGIMAPNSFGGSLTTQVTVAVNCAAITYSTYKGITTVRRLQFDKHRAWMLRTWALSSSILLQRVIQFTTTIIISVMKSYYAKMPCEIIGFVAGEERLQQYQSCLPGGSGHALVNAKINSLAPEERSASLRLTFGMSLAMAIVIRAVVVEMYISKTPAEARRLREISAFRQKKESDLAASTVVPSEDFDPLLRSTVREMVRHRIESLRADSQLIPPRDADERLSYGWAETDDRKRF